MQAVSPKLLVLKSFINTLKSNILLCNFVKVILTYRVSSNKHRASNKRRPLIKAAPSVIHIEISVSPLISVALLNAVLIRIVTIFH